MPPDQKQEMKDTVRAAAKDAAVGLVEKSVDKKKNQMQKRSGSASVALYEAA